LGEKKGKKKKKKGEGGKAQGVGKASTFPVHLRNREEESLYAGGGEWKSGGLHWGGRIKDQKKIKF